MESSGSESIINGLLNWKGLVVTFCLTCWRTSALKLQWKYLDSDTKLFLCQTNALIGSYSRKVSTLATMYDEK